MNTNRKTFDAILGYAKNRAREDASIAGYFSNYNLKEISFSFLSQEECDGLEDACYDFFINEAPEIESYEAKQDQDFYTCSIRGIEGAFFIQVQDFDDIGFFESLDIARNDLFFRHGEFFISSDSEPES